ncbi:MAG: hypothetical protein PHI27_06685 [Eubacteriales bacterium]|nr:hypothetical protein [Eubacteriales bacterium]MDD4513760.1 hypothetical protein [Eubacteriales bacterium]
MIICLDELADYIAKCALYYEKQERIRLAYIEKMRENLYHPCLRTIGQGRARVTMPGKMRFHTAEGGG